MTSFGFHSGPNGNLNGIGDSWRALDAARVPAFLKSTDFFGPCWELANIAAASGVPHTIIYRISTRGQDNGIAYDVPDYALSPVAAAAKHWTNTRAKLPPEIDSARVWIEPINEPDKNRADWLGQFAVELAKIANGQGYKVTMFGWSSGEPEPSGWSTPGMLAYLRYCAANPGRAAVSLHEYSYNVNNIKDGYPNKIGRFTQLLTVCQQNNIAYPEIHLTEWGWEYQRVPTPDAAMLDLEWAHGVYAPYPNVKVGAIWHLGGGFGGIANEAQKLIIPVTQFNLDHQGEVPPPPPPTGYKSVVFKIAQEHTVDEWAGIARLAHGEYKRTLTASGDNCLVMVGDGNAESYAVVFDPALPSQAATIQQLTAAGLNYQTRTYREPLPTEFRLASPVQGISLVVTSGGLFNYPRNYSPPFHEGLDLRAVSASGQPVKILAAAAGVIDGIRRVDPGDGYGIYIRIKTVFDGVTYIIWYGHLSVIPYSLGIGNWVGVGQEIGTAGNTGNSSGVHLHLTAQKIPGGLSGYIVPSVIDPAPLLGLPASTLPGPGGTPPPQTGLDMAKYFLPASGNFGQILILKNNWGAGDERCQLQAENGGSFVTKNQQYERRTIDASYIRLTLDTSPGNGEFYTVTGNWLPRYMSPGATFTRTETITFRYKSNCQPVPSKPAYTATSSIKFDAHHTNWTCPESGITLPDVIELSWFAGGRVDEQYWFAAGLGLVRWSKYSGQTSWIHELVPVGSQSNNVKEVGCYS